MILVILEYRSHDIRHLLGKKSWNVYNADNIAKVKRDEAAVAAREQAVEQRMQEVDAERRIQQLRGLPVEAPLREQGKRQTQDEMPGRESRRRRIAGEDDTDRDIRSAQENSAVAVKANMQMKSQKSSDAPLTDAKGHINLFPMEESRHNAPKNAEVEADKAKKRKEFQDQYTMRLENAAGFKQTIGQKPWYQSTGVGGLSGGEAEIPSKDVWGNEDPRRKEREKMKRAADDPLAAIQKGVAGLREVKRERAKWEEEKDREIREIEEAERHQEQKRRRRRRTLDLDGFSLNGSDKAEYMDRHRHRRREESSRRSHRDRSQSPDHSRHRSHHHRKRSNVIRNKPGWEVGSGGRYSNQFTQA